MIKVVHLFKYRVVFSITSCFPIYLFYFIFSLPLPGTEHGQENVNQSTCVLQDMQLILKKVTDTIFSGTWATTPLMMCAESADYCIMPDKADIVDCLVLL